MVNKECTELTINERLFREVQQYMREHPEDFDMAYGFKGRSTCPLVKQYGKEVSLCGTTMCIAGTAVWLGDTEFRKNLIETVVTRLILFSERMSENVLDEDLDEDLDENIGTEVAWEDINTKARELLGLTINQANYLFHFHKHHHTFWCEKGRGFLKHEFKRFSTDFVLASDNSERVEVACKVIDKFLEVQGEIFDWQE